MFDVTSLTCKSHQNIWICFSEIKGRQISKTLNSPLLNMQTITKEPVPLPVKTAQQHAILCVVFGKNAKQETEALSLARSETMRFLLAGLLLWHVKR